MFLFNLIWSKLKYFLLCGIPPFDRWDAKFLLSLNSMDSFLCLNAEQCNHGYAVCCLFFGQIIYVASFSGHDFSSLTSSLRYSLYFLVGFIYLQTFSWWYVKQLWSSECQSWPFTQFYNGQHTPGKHNDLHTYIKVWINVWGRSELISVLGSNLYHLSVGSFSCTSIMSRG